MRIEWSSEAEATLLTMPPSDAETVFDAVELTALTGRGFVRDMLDGAGTHALYVGNYIAFFVRDAKVVRVLRVRARR